MQQQTSSISNFKRFFLRILLPLILIVSVVGVLFSIFFEQKIIFNSDLCGAYKVHRITNETHEDEVPVFGSSRAEGSYIPDSLGKTFFNYGLPGTKYDVTLFFLQQECTKKKNDPLIVLNFDLDGLITGLGDISNYIPSVGNAEVKALIGNQYKPYYSIPFLKYYGLFDTYTRFYINNKVQLTKISNKGAALDKNILTKKSFDALVEQRKNTKVVFTNKPELETKLLRIIKEHPERIFAIVIAPYHSSYFVNYSNPMDAELFIAKLRAMQNVRVFDFSKMPLADELFLNTTHVNYKGAQVFSHILKDSLAAIRSTVVNP